MSHNALAASDNKHLDELWPLETRSGEARSAKEQVQALVETEGWKRLMESIDARLRYEQLLAMRTAPKAGVEERHERTIGRWAGLSSLEGLANGIIEHGKAAEARQAA
jgi:hypothetical protein